MSSDRDDASFKEYLKEMPWKALPFAARATKERLSALFEVEGIPTLVFVRRDGTVRDTVMDSMSAGEWPEVRAQLLYLLNRAPVAAR